MYKKSIYIVFVILMVFSSVLISYSQNEYYKKAYNTGYTNALTDVKNSLKGTLEFSWTDLGNRTYLLIAYLKDGTQRKVNVQADLQVTQYRNGIPISSSNHAGVLTAIGKDFIAQQLSGSASTTNAIYISVSADTADGMSSSSTQLTNEINANGFTRHSGTYAHTASTNTYTVSYQFTSSGTQTVQLWGCQWSVTAQSNNNLLCYDTSSAKNTVSGDLVTATWTFTLSG